MNGYDFLVRAAKASGDDGEHWFRYLHKRINEKGILLESWEIEKAVQSPELSDFQRVTLIDATTQGTCINEYISSLSKPGWHPSWRNKMFNTIKELFQTK